MIRLATMEDLDAILKIYSAARKFMIKSGNPNQWGTSHPPHHMLVQDISKKQLFVYVENNIIHGVFAFILGVDPTYNYIEGKWLNQEPYGTIHRIASSGKVKRVFQRCLDFCKTINSNIRIDTHADNYIMQKLLADLGFVRCGIIYVDDGSPRIAYHLSF